MKRVFIIYLIVFNLFDVMVGQEYYKEITKPNNKLIYKQKIRIIRKLKKSNCNSTSDSLDFIFIYNMNLKQKPTPEIFNNNEFLNEVSFSYFKRNKFPRNYTIIFNEKKSVLGYVEDKPSVFVYCFHSTKNSLKYEYESIVKYYSEVSPEIIFQINMTPSNLYFSLKNKNLKVLIFNNSNNELKVIDIRTFVTEFWNDFFVVDKY